MSKIDLNKLATSSQVATKQTFADRVKATLANSTGTDDEGNTNPPDEYAVLVPNRIGMMLDCSGSMGGSSIVNLRSAAEEYVMACNFADTSVALYTFGAHTEMRGGLTRYSGALIGYISRLQAHGDTPMHRVVSDAIGSLPMTRGLLVSDGGASDWGHWHDKDTFEGDTILEQYKAAGIPIDCVHIGQGTDGEALLRRIAEKTGGIFIKFKDTGNFAKAFKFLAPANRALLGDGRKLLKELGADEVR